MDSHSHSTKSVTISKFSVEDNPIYAKVSWKENETDIFQIQILDNNSSWSGRFSREFGRIFSKNTDEVEEEYYKNVKDALSGETDSYTYDFKITGNSAKFDWKKLFEGSSIRMTHGSVPVHKDNDVATKDNLIDILLNENKLVQEDLKELNTKNELLSNELNKCKVDLDQFINVKTSLEQNLYGKFVNLLNTKKRRIQLLEDNLNNLSSCGNNGDHEDVD